VSEPGERGDGMSEMTGLSLLGGSRRQSVRKRKNRKEREERGREKLPRRGDRERGRNTSVWGV
jgi:hypothetical protein